MEVGRSFEEVWGRSFAGLVGSGFPETCDKRFVLFFCLEKEGNLADISSLFLYGKGRGRKVGRDCVNCST